MALQCQAVDLFLGPVVSVTSQMALQCQAVDLFLGPVVSVTSQMALQCQASSFIGSELGLVGSVSVYCDWVR